MNQTYKQIMTLMVYRLTAQEIGKLNDENRPVGRHTKYLPEYTVAKEGHIVESDGYYQFYTDRFKMPNSQDIHVLFDIFHTEPVLEHEVNELEVFETLFPEEVRELIIQHATGPNGNTLKDFRAIIPADPLRLVYEVCYDCNQGYFDVSPECDVIINFNKKLEL
jgi:hypothetical protein